MRAKIKSFAEIENKIHKLGAVFVKEKKQIDIYFGEIYLYKKIGYSFMMRIRDEEGKILLTYKGAKTKKDGEWEEYELLVAEKRVAIEMLKSMGLEKIIEVKKKRKEYKFKEFSICLDSIRGLGNFVEIECLCEDAYDGKRRLHGLMIDLGIKTEDVIHKGYITMLLAMNNSPYSKYIRN